MYTEQHHFLTMCDKKKVGDISVLLNNNFFQNCPLPAILFKFKLEKPEFYRLFIQVIV